MSLRVAIVGSGPSGFYAAEALFKSGREVSVDMFDRLATPFGLLRGGVAPDHQKMKSVAKAYTRIASHEGFRFFGNVKIGADLSIDELKPYYHAVIFACGAETDKSLGIPGEDLPGSHAATEFVGWYNGHPDYQNREFDLSQESVAIIGQGNVAIDVCRILSKTPEELSGTDITENALVALRKSKVKKIYLIGRRGPAQAAFTELEIKEFGELSDAGPALEALDLSEADKAELEIEGSSKARRNVAVLESFLERDFSDKPKKVVLKFLRSPIRIEGDGRVQRLVLEKNQLKGEAGAQKARGTGETESIEVGLVFRSIGYKGVGIDGLVFDAARGVIPNELGRVGDGIYATGWIKRGPSGVIGTNRKDSQETVACLLEDFEDGILKPIQDDGNEVSDLLRAKGVRAISFADWEKLDVEEIRRGDACGKVREKFTSLADVLDFLG